MICAALLDLVWRRAVEVAVGREQLARAEEERREMQQRIEDLRNELADTQDKLTAVSVVHCWNDHGACRRTGIG